MSNIYAPTLKEDPVEADLASHRLLLRAGMIRKTAAGVYTYMPLALRSINKIKKIICEEMEARDGQEISMPIIQPAELWAESGRWGAYGPELMRFEDRHGHEFALGPTHEEIVTALVRNELRSYKQLPLNLFQIHDKFRDEIRPRFGLMRSREFIMKDGYSFHASQDSLAETYNQMGEAYEEICKRLGVEFRPVTADSGQIGGDATVEYMALAQSGEASLVFCECGYAADDEAASAQCVLTEDTLHTSLELIETPNCSTIADLALFMNVPENGTVKALAFMDGNNNPAVAFIAGDHELNELKMDINFPGWHMMTPEELVNSGLVKGFIGPVGIAEGVKVIADENLKRMARWICGANQKGYHYAGAIMGDDFAMPEFMDLQNVKPGDLCPDCGLPLDGARGIEVAQIFQLGQKYSKAMNATFSDKEGKEVPYFMGCYGVGVSRMLAAIVEQYNDDYGIKWPVTVAPYEVVVVPLSVGDDVVYPVAQNIANELSTLGIETIIDDRDERAGVKFNDNDLMGFPYQVVVGKRGVKEGTLEVKNRATNEKVSMPIDEISTYVAASIASEKARLS